MSQFAKYLQQDDAAYAAYEAAAARLEEYYQITVAEGGDEVVAKRDLLRDTALAFGVYEAERAFATARYNEAVVSSMAQSIMAAMGEGGEAIAYGRNSTAITHGGSNGMAAAGVDGRANGIVCQTKTTPCACARNQSKGFPS